MKPSHFSLKTEEELEELRKLPLSVEEFLKEYHICATTYHKYIHPKKINLHQENKYDFQCIYDKNPYEIDQEYISMRVPDFREKYKVTNRIIHDVIGTKKQVMERHLPKDPISEEKMKYQKELDKINQEVMNTQSKQDYWKTDGELINMYSKPKRQLYA